MTDDLKDYCDKVDDDSEQEEEQHDIETEIESKIAAEDIKTSRKLDYTLESSEERKQYVEKIINLLLKE